MKLKYKPKLKIVKTKSPHSDDMISGYHSDEGVTYNNEKILSGVESYKAMLEFLHKYMFPHIKDDEFLFRLSNMIFNAYNETFYDEPWEIWEKVVNDILKDR